MVRVLRILERINLMSIIEKKQVILLVLQILQKIVQFALEKVGE